MKYERMKKSSMRCNAVASTDRDIEKVSNDILRARNIVYDVADDVKKEFPIRLRRISRLVEDPSITRIFEEAFGQFQIEMKYITSYIDTAVNRLNKGSFPACVKFLNLTKWSVKQAYGALEKLIGYRYLPMNDIMNYVFRITNNLTIAVRDLEAAASKISSM